MNQASPAQKVGESAQAAGSAKEKDDEQGEDESAQKALPNAGAEEVFNFGLEVRVGVGLVAKPEAEGSPWNVMVAGVLAL